jgi:hypothetical protein
MSELNQLNSDIDSLDRTKDRVIVENNAQTIFDHIKSLENDPKNRQRWIWELLQNAQDASNSSPVDIEISWDGKNLSFSHDGEPFTEDDITHLIFHGSSKKEQEGKTGKFGTGFMTTHLLSKLVRIEGDISDGRSFNFILNRSGETPKDTAITLNQSWEDFKKSIKQQSPIKTTKFSYLDLTVDGTLTVENVLAQSELLVPSVLAFATNIKRLIINHGSGTDIFEKEISPDNIAKLSLRKNNSSNKKYFQLFIHSLPDEKGKLALPLDNDGLIESLDKEIPRLFITFPLIGTEKAFPLPFLIHSPHFEPSPEREKIWLTVDTAETKTNKSILETAFKEYLIIANALIKENKANDNFHLLANLGRLPDVEWLDKDWYISQLNFLIENIDGLPIVETCSADNKKQTSLKKATIPFSYNNQNAIVEAHDVWELIAILKPDSTPPEKHVDYWFQIISDRETFQTSHKSAFTLKKICEYVENIPNHELNKLKTELLDPLDFVARLIQCLEKYNLQQFWNEYSILPNQGSLLKKAGDLKQEEKNDEGGIGKTIKDISHQLGIQIRDSLLHENIVLSSSDFKLQIETRSAVVVRLLHSVKSEGAEEKNSNWITGSMNLLQWVLKNNRYNDLIGYPVKMANSKWDRIQQDRDPAFLCPTEIWRQSFRPYVELFPNDFILAPDYHFIFADNEVLHKITEKGWLLRDPLYTRTDELSGREVFSMVTRRVDKDKLEKYENAEWKMKSSAKFSQLAFIDTPKDKGVIDRVRGSAKRTKLFLQFILEVLIKEDVHGFSRFLVDVNDKDTPDINVGIYPSIWMLKLKERDWVKSLAGNTSERPTVDSLLPYFANNSEDEGLYKALQRQDVSRFLHFLGIAVGDLLRNIRAGENEEERMEWDRSYVSILMNQSLTPQKVTNMLSDSAFIKQYEEKKELEKKVLENQAIGEAVEAAFAEALSSQPGYSVQRLPVGQDYEAECDFLHPLLLAKTDGTKQKFLIEIKSSRSIEVKMTITQGSTACTTLEKYILCVVPFNSEVISPQLIKNNARFLTTIPDLLRDRVKKVGAITSLQFDAIQTYNPITDLVRTAIEGTQVRYAIQQKAWKLGPPETLSFEEFVKGLL